MTANDPNSAGVREEARRVLREARDIARRDAGPHGEFDRVLQVSWLLCLKVLDALQQAAEIQGVDSGIRIEHPYRWRDWAAGPNGLAGVELLAFVESIDRHQSNKAPGLLPYLRNYSGDSDEILDTTIRTIFSCADNLLFSGQILREVIDCISRIELSDVTTLWAAADAYDDMLREAYHAVDSQGGFFTPRPLVRFIIQQLNPLPGERVLDLACGTAGFLTETLRNILIDDNSSLAQSYNKLRSASKFLHGSELEQLPYLLGGVNLILHGAIDTKLSREDSLTGLVPHGGALLPQEEVGYDVAVTDPPLAPNKNPTAHVKKQMPLIFWQFLEAIMCQLRHGGRAAVTIPLWVLSRPEDSGGTWTRFIGYCDLHTVVVLDEGVYQPYSAEAACVLFFKRGCPAEMTWIYNLHSRHGWARFTKTRPIEDDDFTKCSEWWPHRNETEEATRVPIEHLGRFARDVRR